jgi:hypothetical protein
MITDYLIELLEELRLPPRRRRRILAEVEDHLSCAAAELHAAGLSTDEAEQEAVRRFGSPSEIARSFVDLEAARSGSRAVRAAGALALLFAVIAVGPLGRLIPTGAFPVTTVPFVLGQVALVAGALTLIRSRRTAPEGGPRGARLVLILRGVTVVVACAGTSVAVDAIAGRGITAASWAALAGIGTAAAATAVTVSRSWRLAAAAGAAYSSEDEDIISDMQVVALRAIATAGRRVPALKAPLDRAAELASALPKEATRRAPRLCTWLDLRTHPWRFAFTIAALAGLALAAGHGLMEGVNPRHITGAVVAGVLIATIEALSALAGFAVLGRFLGIRTRSYHER